MTTLTFDFPDAATGRARRTVFRNPARLVVARSLDEVVPALAAVADAAADGLHAAGFIAYEAAPALDPRLRVHPGKRTLPLVWFGLFESPEAPSPDASDPDPPPAADWRLDVGRDAYGAAVAAIRAAIAEGRTYQVNLTARMRATLDRVTAADPARLYESLRRAQGTGYHALLELDDHVIGSVSPELFFRTTGRRVEARPMKGTRPRGRWSAEDRALAAELVASEKDRAENLMIVDLLRNDLGRVCETGTVRVPSLHELERYRTVWQLTSTVEGRLRDDVGLVDLLRALFPCGSVTGAPKVSTMDVIARLEASPREVYCGAIGMLAPGGDAVFNVPIRTLWWDRSTRAAAYGTGGGVVWDSTPEGEYDELVAKAVVLREPWPAFELIETLALRDGRLVRLERHLARLADSAAYFGFPFTEAEIRDRLEAVAREAGPGPLRVRLTLGGGGEAAVSCSPFDAPEGAAFAAGDARPVVLAGEPVDPGDRFLYHKTTRRAGLDARRADRPELFDVLLRNTRGEATEFTRGNLVAELGGRLLTPPLEAGLLPGCLRAELIEAGTIEEAAIPVTELARATRLWFVNSARGWIPVRLPGR